MSNVEKMRNQLMAWGLLPQVLELKNAGYSLEDAIRFVHIAHTQNAYPVARFTV